jgi:hypothetical protein
MTFDLQRVLESKEALRRDLASRPVAEKLAMLDVLRDRLRTIRAAARRKESTGMPEPALEPPAGGGTAKAG